MRLSVLYADAKAIYKWEGYLFKHTYPFVLIDSVSFRAYQITVLADKYVLPTLNYGTARFKLNTRK